MSFSLRSNEQLLEWFDKLIQEKKLDELVENLFRVPTPRLVELLLILQGRTHPMFAESCELWRALSEKFREKLEAAKHVRNGRARQTNLPGHVRYLFLGQAINKETIYQYFYWDSRAWLLIREHIVSAERCCLIDRPEDRIACHRGTGYSIELREAGIYADDYKQGDKGGTVRVPASVFWIKFEVEYERGEEDGDDVYRRSYSLNVPLELEDDVDDATLKARFEAWVKERGEENRREIQQKTFPLLKQLVTSNPEEARRILREMPKDKPKKKTPTKK